MIPPPAIPNETARMEAVESLALMYTPAEERFDRITRLATRLLETPIALVTLVSEEKQWFKSSVGLDVAETSRDVSFCGHAIASDSTLVIEDAQADERFADNPLVTGDPNIRFYAGHPIHASDGSRVGTVCVIDRRTRTFTEQDRAALRDLAAICENEIARAQVSDAHRDLVE
jgi:GAF domain-containing protein